MDSDDLVRGALRALINSASLVEGAAHLYQVGHDQGCIVLAVSAREKLGRAALLASRAKKMAPGEQVISWSDPSTVTIEDSRVPLMSVAAGVANTLIGLRTEQPFSKAKNEVSLPNMGEFTTRVFSRSRHAVPNTRHPTAAARGLVVV
jgi:hypothetical protein